MPNYVLKVKLAQLRIRKFLPGEWSDHYTSIKSAVHGSNANSNIESNPITVEPIVDLINSDEAPSEILSTSKASEISNDQVV